MPIRILPPEIASQIAAGEVVERPASVVKELLENALDAGARHISIAVEGAGRRMIEVSDDGAGIPADELPLAVTRHATSKLTMAGDLFRIRSLGFRGEALASIGSVARMTITSRPTEASQGARLHVEGGQIGLLQPVGAPPGTLVRVEDLFYNVPARLKFLKADITERRQIDDLVTRYAIAYPGVRIQFRQEDHLSLQTSGNGDRREVLAALYGVEVARHMLEVLAEFEELRISGYISPLTITRSNRREITFFVNGRWIQDVALTTALVQAYHTMLMVGRYPQAILFLELPPETVDVNVHPAKAEVRFRTRDRVFSGIQRAVRRALLANAPVPGFGNLSVQSTGIPADSALSPWEQAGDLNPQVEFYPEYPEDVSQLSLRPAVQPTLNSGRVPLLRLVGQVASSYVVAEGPDGLYLVDQHAAHERVLFEHFMAQRGSPIPAQSLLEPVLIEFPPAGAKLLVEQIHLLEHLGFQVEVFGANAFLVRGIPALLVGSDPAAALRVLVEDFEEDETPLQAEMEARMIARICKRAAIKAGQILSTEEQRALLNNLEACQAPRTCPHGRPTMIHLSVDLLERQFGRKRAR